MDLIRTFLFALLFCSVHANAFTCRGVFEPEEAKPEVAKPTEIKPDAAKPTNPVSPRPQAESAARPIRMVELLDWTDQNGATELRQGIYKDAPTVLDSSLIGINLRIVWLDTETEKAKYLDGKVVHVDIGSQLLVIKSEGREYGLSLKGSQDIRLYALDPADPHVSEDVIAKLMKMDHDEKIMKSQNRLVRFVLWLTHFSSQPNTAAQIEARILVDRVAALVKGGKESVSLLKKELMPFMTEVESAFIRVTELPHEISALRAQLLVTTTDLDLRRQLSDQIQLREKDYQRYLGTVAQNKVKYIWVKGTLYYMGKGADGCDGPCQQPAKEVYAQSGVDDNRIRRSFPDFIGEKPRPWINEIRALEDSNPQFFTYEWRYAAGLQVRALLRSIIHLRPVMNAIHRVIESAPSIADRLAPGNPQVKAAAILFKKFGLKFLDVMTDSRIRHEHFPRISAVRFDFLALEDVDKIHKQQLEKLRQFAAIDPEILITMSRTIEAEDTWNALVEYAKQQTSQQIKDFVIKMDAATEQGKLLGSISTQTPPTPLAQWVTTAVFGVSGVSFGYLLYHTGSTLTTVWHVFMPYLIGGN